jgi:hypothetical protein
VTHRMGARWVALRKLVSPRPSAATPPFVRGPRPADRRAHPPPASRSSDQRQDHEQPPQPHGRPCPPPEGLGTGPIGQHYPRTDRQRVLGPGPHLAGPLTTAPDPLAQASTHRPAISGQVAHANRAPGRGARPASRSLPTRPRWPWSEQRTATRRR